MGGIEFDLLAQIGDIEPQELVVIAVFRPPHFGEQRFLRNDPSGVFHQVQEQPILRGAQLDRLAADDHGPAREVDRQILVYGQRRVGGRLGRLDAPQHGTDAT